MEKPSSHQTVMPYLIISDAHAFIEFTKQTFNATEVSRHLHEDGSIMHAEILIGDATIMMGQSSDTYPPIPASLFVYVKDTDQSYQKAIDAGASSIMEISDQPYGRTCGVLDPCNNTWWITSVEHM